MIIRLLSVQIPVFWNAIKMTVKEADEVDEANLQPYLNELLHALLNDTAQCFIRLDENKTLIALLVTRVMVDKVTGEKYLYLQSLYSWKKPEDGIWQRDVQFVMDFAKQQECKYISCQSRNEAIWNLVEQLGFAEKTRVFDLRIG